MPEEQNLNSTINQPITSSYNPTEQKLPGVFDLIKSSFEIYKKKIVKILSIYLPLYLAFFLMSTIIGWVGKNIVEKKDMGLLLLLILMVVGYLIASIIVNVCVYWYITKEETEITIKDIYLGSKSYVFKFIVVAVLMLVLFVLWGFLFIIPGLIMLVYYSFSLWVLLNENKEGYSAIKRSIELVKGYWWAVFGRNIALFFLQIIALIIIEVFVAFTPVLQNDTISSIIDLLVTIFLWPFSLIFSFLIYKHLRLIKGQDIVVGENNK